MKRLPLTDKIKTRMAAALEQASFTDEEAANYAFYETILINDLPVSKIGSVYDGSRFTQETLQEMVNYINNEKFLPLHTLHMQGRELPQGRVFSADLNKAVTASGKQTTEVRGLFYVPLNTDKGKEIAANLDNGIINEVSIGFRAKSLLCSGENGQPCSFDYMGDNTFMNWLDQTCSNDHTIGKNGVHTISSGLHKFYELSLVSQGAADHARIVAPSQSIAAANDDAAQTYKLLYATKGKEKEDVMKLTAAQIAELKAGFEKDGKRAIDAKFAGVTGCLALIKDDMTMSDAEAARSLFKTELAKFNTDNPVADPKPANPAEEKLNLSINEVMDLKLDLREATKAVETLTASITAKDTTIATLTTENTQLKTNKVQLDALTAQVTPVKEFLKLACQNLLVATGVKNPQIPEDLSELVASIKVAQGNLSKLPTGGLLLSAEAGSTANNGNATNTGKDPESFKVKK